MTRASFNNVVIIGVGLIGGSLGLALKKKGFSGNIIGVDSPSTLNWAIEKNVINEGYSREDMDKAISKADLIFICTPILKILELLPVIGKHAKPGTLITDVGSAQNASTDLPHFVLLSSCSKRAVIRIILSVRPQV